MPCHLHGMGFVVAQTALPVGCSLWQQPDGAEEPCADKGVNLAQPLPSSCILNPSHSLLSGVQRADFRESV